MRHTFLITVATLVLVPAAFSQQKQPTNPYAPPPPPPKLPSAQPDKGCSAQAASGDGSKWKGTSTCPPPAKTDDTPPLTTGPADAGQQKSTAEDNPFPEDVSRRAQDAARAAEEGKPENSSGASPSPGESSSRNGKMSDADLLGERESRISNGAGGFIHDPRMAANDVHVGQFYLNREDYKGAYDRFKEASLVDPENSDAVFYLAEAARHISHTDEAKQNYQLYLEATPDGPKAKEAKKALKELGSAKH